MGFCSGPSEESKTTICEDVYMYIGGKNDDNATVHDGVVVMMMVVMMMIMMMMLMMVLMIHVGSCI